MCNNMNKGFTIIELVITIFILSIAVVGVFNAFSIITILTSDSSDRLTATYLAQEGMELVRNIRDQNWLNMDSGTPTNATWIDGLTCGTPECAVNYNSNSVSDYNENNYLYINNEGFYDYVQTGTPTKFKRKITVTHPIDANNNPIEYILKIVVEVSWNKKATLLNLGKVAGTCEDNCIKTEGTLYNWYATLSSDKDIISFGFGIEGENSTIEDNSITVILPSGTSLWQTAIFETTGFLVKIGDEMQVSGDGRFERDFFSQVTYTVVASDGSEKNYTVNVIVETED